MILLRHGQSEFNLHFGATRRDPGIVDPRLTDLGHAPGPRSGRGKLAGQGIERIIASPYTRALQNRPPGRRGARSPGHDRSDRPRALRLRLRHWLSPSGAGNATGQSTILPRVDDIWWPAAEEPEESIIARAAHFRAMLAERHDWTNTLVVSHWGFILSLTGQSVANGQWLRCDPTEPAPARLVWRA